MVDARKVPDHLNCSFIGVWPSLVRRLLWVQEIASSNPATPTNNGD